MNFATVLRKHYGASPSFHENAGKAVSRGDQKQDHRTHTSEGCDTCNDYSR